MINQTACCIILIQSIYFFSLHLISNNLYPTTNHFKGEFSISLLTNLCIQTIWNSMNNSCFSSSYCGLVTIPQKKTRKNRSRQCKKHKELNKHLNILIIWTPILLQIWCKNAYYIDYLNKRRKWFFPKSHINYFW